MGDDNDDSVSPTDPQVAKLLRLTTQPDLLVDVDTLPVLSCSVCGWALPSSPTQLSRFSSL